MLKTIKKLIKNDEGQALVLVAISLVVLLGFAAIAIDYGYLTWQRRSLQNAADASALAAAWELPDTSLVDGKAKEYAKANSSELVDSEIIATIQNDEKEVKVDVSHTYNTFLGGIIGSSSQQISATATAEKFNVWAGEALPFINFNAYSSEDPLFGVWGKEEDSSGIFGSILGYEIVNAGDPNTIYFEIDYTKGIKIDSGLVASIKKEVGMVAAQDKNPYYIWSLKSSVIETGEVTVTDKHGNPHTRKIQGKGNEGLKSEDTIDPSQIVLLEINLENFEFKNANNYSFSLKYENEYDIFKGVFPEDYEGPGDITSRLIN